MRHCHISRAPVARCLLLLLCLALACWAVEPKNEFYVMNLKPPSVAIVSPEALKIAAEIPLDGEPSFALTDPSNRFLYVLENGYFRTDGLLRPGVGKLAIVDLGSRKLVKTIQLAWNTKNLALSKNGKYLVSVNEGKARSKKKLPEEQGSITIFDTTTNDVVATLSTGRLGEQVVYNSDLSRIVVLSRGEFGRKGAATVKPMVTVFSLAQEKPLAEIQFDRAKEISLSPDEKWVYVLDQGIASKKPTEAKNGSVHVIDLAEMKLAKSHDAGIFPRWTVDSDSGSLHVLATNSSKEKLGRLFSFRGTDLESTSELGRNPQFIRSFGNHTGNYVATYDELRLVPPNAPVATSFTQLNSRKGAPPLAADIKTLGGNLPDETLFIPQKNKLVATLVNGLGGPTSKIAIVDLEKNRVENVITTGRGSVKFGKFMGAMALSVAMSSLSYYANYSVAVNTGQPYFFYNVYSFSPAPPNLELTSSADGEFVYALNTQTNDVTIVKTADGTVVDKIAVGGGCKRVALAPGGKFVYSFTNGQFDLIDTATNKKTLEHKVESGRINTLHVFDGAKRIAALTKDSVLLWDAEKGVQTAKIDGFHQAVLLVEPKPPAQQ